MDFEQRKQLIKQALLKGGVIVLQRGAGKTSAMAEILNEDPYAVVVINREATRQALLRLGVNKDQIVTASALEGSAYFGKLEDKRLYGDELKLAEIERLAENRNFHGAVTSVNFPIRKVEF